MKLKISCEIFANSFSTSMVPSEAVRWPVLYSTAHSTSVQWPSTHPPKLDPSSPPHPASGWDGCEDARPRRLEAAGPGTDLRRLNWPQSRSNQRSDLWEYNWSSSVQGWPGHRVSWRSQASLSIQLGSNPEHFWQKPTSETERSSDRSGDRAHRSEVSHNSNVSSVCSDVYVWESNFHHGVFIVVVTMWTLNDVTCRQNWSESGEILMWHLMLSHIKCFLW